MLVFLTGCTLFFSWFSSHYMVALSDQVDSEVDLITFLITAEPSLGKQTLEKIHRSDVSMSPVCCQVVARVSVAESISPCCSRAVFLEVCMHAGFSDPCQTESVDNRSLEAGT